MDDNKLNSANADKAKIAAINNAQAAITLSGTRVNIRITNATDSDEKISPQALKTLLGQSAYDTICATALSSINTALATAKTSAQTDYTNL